MRVNELVIECTVRLRSLPHLVLNVAKASIRSNQVQKVRSIDPVGYQELTGNSGRRKNAPAGTRGPPLNDLYVNRFVV
jgi:hypothetical protein